MTNKIIPEGYMEDSQGRLVPEDVVKPVDKLRDELVMKLVEQARATSVELRRFKQHAFGEIKDFCELSASEYGKELGGIKGNVNLVSYDGRYKVNRAVSELFIFTEQLQTAKQLIDECIKDWSPGSRSEIRALVNDAFQTDKQGKVNIKRILSLRKFDFDDERWKKAMEAISDSLSVVGSRVYVRVYERIEGTEQWKQIPLDMASIEVDLESDL